MNSIAYYVCVCICICLDELKRRRQQQRKDDVWSWNIGDTIFPLLLSTTLALIQAIVMEQRNFLVQSCSHLGLFSAKDSHLDVGVSHVFRLILKESF